MRCKKCRKEITGIGKPALPPAVPALVAWAGGIWAMWFLTLGENPLPSWTPTPGWAVGLGTLALATVMGWFALTRRKCPECGSKQMFEAMEEEALLASERQAALEQARNGASGPAPDRHALRVEIEAELRAASAKEAAELRGRLEKELREEIGQQMRAAQADNEHGLRQRLTSELRPEIEKELRPHIEQKLRPEIEKELRPHIEHKLRPEIENELRPHIEQKLRPEIENELRAHIERTLRSEIEKELRASLSASEGPPHASPSVSKEAGKPTSKEPAVSLAKTPTPVSALHGQGRSSSAHPTPPPATKAALSDASKSDPVDSAPAASKGHGTIPRFPMPAMPRPAGTKTASPESNKTPTPVKPHGPEKTPSPVSVKTAETTPAPTNATALEPRVSTSAAPSASGPDSSKTPVLVSVNPTALAKTASPLSAKPALTPSPVTGKPVGTPVPGTTTDPRERAERRARVIVSDLSLYHKDLLAKAAQAPDARKELGTLWRDAVLAYDRTVPMEVRSSTHYLDDELDKYLAQLRQTQAPAGQAHG